MQYISLHINHQQWILHNESIILSFMVSLSAKEYVRACFWTCYTCLSSFYHYTVTQQCWSNISHYHFPLNVSTSAVVLNMFYMFILYHHMVNLNAETIFLDVFYFSILISFYHHMANVSNKAIFLNMFYMYIFVQIYLLLCIVNLGQYDWTYSTCAPSTSTMVLSLFMSIFILSLL